MAIRRRKIESLIDDLLTSYGISEAPVPVDRIAKAKGARVSYQSLDDDVSGFLYRDTSQVVIGINTHHAPVRQNFTAAHELGHLLLHEQEHLHIDKAFRVRLRDDVSAKAPTNLNEKRIFSLRRYRCHAISWSRTWRAKNSSTCLTMIFSQG